jgi:hypothetical protein
MVSLGRPIGRLGFTGAGVGSVDGVGTNGGGLGCIGLIFVGRSAILFSLKLDGLLGAGAEVGTVHWIGAISGSPSPRVSFNTTLIAPWIAGNSAANREFVERTIRDFRRTSTFSDSVMGILEPLHALIEARWTDENPTCKYPAVRNHEAN